MYEKVNIRFSNEKILRINTKIGKTRRKKGDLLCQQLILRMQERIFIIW